jgi:DNA end-binding protein Ku
MLDEDGTPLERRYWCPADEEFLDADDIVRGFEVEDGEFVVLTDEELESAAPRKSRDIDLRSFVPRASIDPRSFQRGYFLAPREGSTKAYRLLARVMEDRDRAGIATFVMRAKEYLVAILADRGILRAETLRFADEIRSAEDVGLPEPAKPAAEHVKRFVKEIRALEADDIDPAELLDPKAERLQALVQVKELEGRDIVETRDGGARTDHEEGAEIIDLMDVLRRSLGNKSKASRTKRGGKPTRKRLAGATKEELYERAKTLDISGRSHMTKDELIDAIRRSA